jgi:hypothetical protein
VASALLSQVNFHQDFPWRLRSSLSV